MKNRYSKDKNKKVEIMDRYAISITIEGKFEDWGRIQSHCEDYLSDSSGIAVGFTTRSISTDFGEFSVKCIIIFLDERTQHHLKPANSYSSTEIFEIGFDKILEKIARKMLINVHLKDRSSELRTS
jgi:hypothetical protein